MTTNVKKGLLVLGIVAALVLIYYTVFSGDAATPDESAVADDGTANLGQNFPLKRGSRGADVQAWQDFIYTQRHGVGTTAARDRYVDGKYGPNTEADTLKVTGSKVVPLATFLDKIGAAVGATALSGAGALETDVSPPAP